MAEITRQGGLPLRARQVTRGNVILAHFRSALMGAVLALVAICGLTAVTTLHDASVHDEVAVQLSVRDVIQVNTPHDYGRSLADMDNSVHLAAHAAGHWMSAEPQDERLPSLAAGGDRFAVVAVPALVGSEPSSLLRPPKA